MRSRKNKVWACVSTRGLDVRHRRHDRVGLNSVCGREIRIGKGHHFRLERAGRVKRIFSGIAWAEKERCARRPCRQILCIEGSICGSWRQGEVFCREVIMRERHEVSPGRQLCGLIRVHGGTLGHRAWCARFRTLLCDVAYNT